MSFELAKSLSSIIKCLRLLFEHKYLKIYDLLCPTSHTIKSYAFISVPLGDMS